MATLLRNNINRIIETRSQSASTKSAKVPKQILKHENKNPCKPQDKLQLQLFQLQLQLIIYNI